LPMLTSSSVFPMLSCSSFKVSGLTCRPLSIWIVFCTG
jgi:hypothetical protein